MADRFQRLFTLTPNLYIEGCPVIIEAGALLKDTESGAVLAQLKMRNIGEEVVSSCRISIKAFATNGDEIEGVSDFSYLDLNAGRGREFGSKTPVMLPDKTARKIAVDINEIVFSDGTVKKMDSNEWKSIPKQKTLGEILQDQELVKQYKLEAGGSADFLPEKRDGFFLCTCGAINLESAETCYNCGNAYENLKSCLDKDFLLGRLAERNEKAAIEKVNTQKKKQMIIKIAAVILVLLIAAVAIGKVPKYPCNIKRGDSFDTVLKKAKSHSEKAYANGAKTKIKAENTTFFGVKDCEVLFEFKNSKLVNIDVTRWHPSDQEADAIYRKWKSKLTRIYGSENPNYDDEWNKGDIAVFLSKGSIFVSISYYDLN